MNQESFIMLNNGEKMPRFGLGTFGNCKDVMQKVIRTALECGYRSIDTAYMYENEEAIGDELQDWFTQGKLERKEVFVTSKLPVIGNRRGHVSHFLKLSLEKLKLDYLDLYLIHNPIGLQYLGDNIIMPKDAKGNILIDNDTDLETLWKGMEEQVEAGKVKAIGVSNFNISQIDRIMKIAKIPPAVNQVELHGYLQQRPLVERCKEFGIAIVAHAPLGAPHQKREGISPVLIENPTVLEIAKRHEKSSAQVLLKFLLQKDIIVIPKSSNPERIKSNFDISDFYLSGEEMKSLVHLDRGEKGRVYNLRNFPGSDQHKEYPYPSCV